MNPTAQGTTPNQQNNNNSGINTNTTTNSNPPASQQQPLQTQTQNNQQQAPSQPQAAPQQPQNQNSMVSPDPNALSAAGGSSLGAMSPPLGQTQQAGQTPQSTYQAPTVGMPTSPTFGSTTQPSATPQGSAKPGVKPAKIKTGGSFPLLPILYVVGGIIFLVVYTVIWAVIFDLTLPFGLSLPF